MMVLELFAGRRCIGRAFEERGHEVFSVDWNRDLKDIDLSCDILELTADRVIEVFGKPDVIWASPDCTTYSIAAISRHRKKNLDTGELGHKRWKRLDYVSSHYGIQSLNDFTIENLVSHIQMIGLRNKKRLSVFDCREWRNIGRVWFKVDPLKITSQWDKVCSSGEKRNESF